MRYRRKGPASESLTAWHDRLIAETELALLVGLRFPKRMPRIPTIKLGAGEFDPEFSLRFWSEALGVDAAELTSLNNSDAPAEKIFTISTPGDGGQDLTPEA